MVMFSLHHIVVFETHTNFHNQQLCK